ncbi:MAG TPA: helix-turn-helix domain-containing protein [Trebonia sp.]
MHTEQAGPGRPDPDATLAAAARTLLGQVDVLAEHARAETVLSEADYREIVEPDDLRAASRETIMLLLNLLAGIDDPALAGTLDKIGRRRARQGVGMDAMLRSFRIDFHIVGESLFTWLSVRPTPSMREWTEFVLPLWQAIDTISVDVSRAYRDAEADMAGELERELRALFDELMYSASPMSPAALRTASRFGLAERGRYLAVRADAPGQGESPERALRQAGAHSVWTQDAGRFTGIVALSQGGCPTLSECLAEVLPGRTGISPPYAELTGTRSHIWLAEAARDSLPAGEHRVMSADADIASVFIGGATEVSRHLAGAMSEALCRGRGTESARLLETLRAYLDGDGSPTSTARTLYRHRNTVLNHLRRFEELTGLDLSRPTDTATAVLAVRAIHRFGSDAGQAP